MDWNKNGYGTMDGMDLLEVVNGGTVNVCIGKVGGMKHKGGRSKSLISSSLCLQRRSPPIELGSRGPLKRKVAVYSFTVWLVSFTRTR